MPPMQDFLKMTANAPGIKTVVKHVRRGMINARAAQLSRHFSDYLMPIIAQQKHTRLASYDIRHQVYCEEKHFLPIQANQLERDAMDAHAIHCLIQHKASQRYAGTVRVVYSTSPQQRLPIEAQCAECLRACEITPGDFPRDRIGEVSRLAVSAGFRRRSTDKFEGAATGDTDPDIYSVKEMRCFPLIAVGLYLAAANICKHHGIEHVFAMMDPRLARNLTFLGFSFRQIGPAVEYHGKRAPYYGSVTEFVDTLPAGFRRLYRHLERDLETQYRSRQASAA